MRSAFLAGLTLADLWTGTSVTVSLAEQTETIHWSKSEFTIPFHIDNDGSPPAAVLLEISTDEGLSWAPYARDGVKSRQFRFTSQGDGLYLFRIKTVDNFGQAYDPGAEPLRVLVDTSSPQLTLEIDTDSVGRLVANFQIVENNPRVDSIRLEFQTELSGGWTSVSFDTNRQGPNELVGQGILDVPSSSRQLVVRLVAKDAAGNESEVTRLPQLPRTASALSGMTLASGRTTPPTGPIASSSPNAPSVNSNPSTARFGSSLQSSVTSPFAEKSTLQSTSNGQSKSNLNVDSLTLPDEKQMPLNDYQNQFGATNASPRYQFQPITNDILVSTDRSNNSALVAKPSPAIEMDSAPLLLSTPEANKLDVSRLDVHRPDSSPKAISTPYSQALQGTTRSLDQRPYYSNSKAFSLDYSVDQNRSSQISSIELWGTADQGKTWELWGTDPDGKSPFDISVETEGLFGFRMVLVGLNGMTANRPRNGDNADAWIFVDTKVPTARLVTAMYGRGNESGSLIIEFNAQDEQFSDRPIKLSYSETMSGPWTTIISSYENSGRFVWQADPNLPPRVYLQIEAFDQAGNIGLHRLDLPVDIEGLAPRGKIQGFRPIQQ